MLWKKEATGFFQAGDITFVFSQPVFFRWGKTVCGFVTFMSFGLVEFFVAFVNSQIGSASPVSLNTITCLFATKVINTRGGVTEKTDQ